MCGKIASDTRSTKVKIRPLPVGFLYLKSRVAPAGWDNGSNPVNKRVKQCQKTHFQRQKMSALAAQRRQYSVLREKGNRTPLHGDVCR